MRFHWPLVSIVCISTLVAAFCGSSALPGDDPSNAEASKLGDARRAVSFKVAARGRTEAASESVDLAIGMVGTIAAVYVDEGDAVEKGKLLAELINGDQRARVSAAEAQVKLRRAELQKLLHGARPEERRQSAALVEKTQSGVALAKQELMRRRSLATTGVSSQQSLEQAVSSLQVAEASDNASRAAFELINAPPRGEDVVIAEANLTLAEANLEEQRAILEKTQLRSPIDGVVLRRYLKTGETISIQPLIPILQVGDTRRVRVRAEIDETEIGRLKLGQRAWATAPAFAKQRFSGVISRIGQRMGRKAVRSEEPTDRNDTNVLDVLIDLDKPGVPLPLGLRVDVFLEPPEIARN